MAARTLNGLDTFVRTRMYPWLTGKSSVGIDLRFSRNQLVTGWSPVPITGSPARRRAPFIAAEWSAIATIPASSTTSSPLPITPLLNGSILFPAAMTGTTLSFLVSATGNGYQTLSDNTGPITVSVAANGTRLLPSALAPWRYVQFVSNASEAAQRALLIMAQTS